MIEAMRYITADEYTAEQAWQALDIARIEGASVRLHWTDSPYKWHVNDGQEVFVVLDGAVDMHVRDTNGKVTITHMQPGMIAHATEGVEHVAHPLVPSRILVIERDGSV